MTVATLPRKLDVGLLRNSTFRSSCCKVAGRVRITSMASLKALSRMHGADFRIVEKTGRKLSRNEAAYGDLAREEEREGVRVALLRYLHQELRQVRTAAILSYGKRKVNNVPVERLGAADVGRNAGLPSSKPEAGSSAPVGGEKRNTWPVGVVMLSVKGLKDVLPAYDIAVTISGDARKFMVSGLPSLRPRKLRL